MKYLTKTTFILITFLILLFINPQTASAQLRPPPLFKQQAQEMQKRLRNFQLENKKRLGLNIVGKLENIVIKLENIKNKLKLVSLEFDTQLNKAKESIASSRVSFTQSKFAEGVKMIRLAQQNLKTAQKILRANLTK